MSMRASLASKSLLSWTTQGKMKVLGSHFLAMVVVERQ
jgi:hypothetical protein